MITVGVIDYGSGNVFSLVRAFEKIDANTLINKSSLTIGCDCFVLPGVGAFPNVMEKLRTENLCETVIKLVNEGAPLLGICVGMQVLFQTSEEFGSHDGLGLLKGQVKRIALEQSSKTRFKVPHVGWSSIAKLKSFGRNGSLDRIMDFEREICEYYFVHSFHAVTQDPDIDVAEVSYGGQSITAAVAKNNLFGVQFHPEKSGEVGLDLLRKFACPEGHCKC